MGNRASVGVGCVAGEGRVGRGVEVELAETTWSWGAAGEATISSATRLTNNGAKKRSLHSLMAHQMDERRRKAAAH